MYTMNVQADVLQHQENQTEVVTGLSGSSHEIERPAGPETDSGRSGEIDRATKSALTNSPEA
jgi:hypothetical protein